MRCHLSNLLHALASAVTLGLAGLTACSASSGEPAAPPTAPAVDAGADGANAPIPEDPIGFRPSAALRTPRALATATRLLDGRVLIVGGEDTDYAMLATAEIYDPATETVTPAAPLPEPRAHHTATLLESGEVLVVGGGQGSAISLPTGEGVLASAVVYDPAKNAWRTTAPLRGPHAGHRAVRLGDGRVLVVGGGDHVGYPCAAIYNNCTVADSIGSAEIYDAKSGTFSATGDLSQPRLAFSLDVLESGLVVAAGGGAANQGLTSVEIFDASIGQWSKGPKLEGQRLYHASGVLGASLVVVGGKIANVGPISNTDVLGVGTTAWRRGASVNVPRTGAKLVPLASRRGLLVGGSNQLTNETLADARIYDAVADTWTPTAPLAYPRYSHAVVTLADGSVLVIGGRDGTSTVAAIERSRSVE